MELVICSCNFFLFSHTYIVGRSLYTILCSSFLGGILFHSKRRVNDMWVNEAAGWYFFLLLLSLSFSQYSSLDFEQRQTFSPHQRIGINCDLGKSVIPHALRLSEQNTCSSVLQAFLMWRGSYKADGNNTSRGLVALTPSLQILAAEFARVMNPSCVQVCLLHHWEHSKDCQQSVR